MGRNRDRKQGPGEQGAPGWIVTYGDMMSLLLTFFILLLSFSTISEEDFNKAMSSLQGALGVLPKNVSIIDMNMSSPHKRRKELEEAARKLAEQIQILGQEKQVKIEYDATGGIKISLPDAILYDAGSATLRPEAAPVLQDVAEVLAQLPDTFIEVKGHTDGRPLSDSIRFRDNYELSYFRADAVARQLINLGRIPIEQFEIVACGPGQPQASNNTEDGRRANRRVEIFVRGLVDKSKIDPLRERTAVPGGSESPAAAAISPRELTELR
jgi:chemotaxis protein MotB